MEFTVETILKNTSEEELFCLFGEFLNRIQEKDGFGVIRDDESYKDTVVILDRTKGEVIRDMIKK